jgi:hypothetical protein
MPVLLAQIEALSPAQFILLIGLIAGVLRSVPVFLQTGNVNIAVAHFSQIVVALALSLLWWIGAALVWWFAVRRRRYPIWLTALHVTLGVAVADVLASVLAMVAGSIETHGAILAELGKAPLMAVLSPLELTLLRSLYWFVEAIALIALGRLVLRMDSLIAPPSIPTHSDAEQPG